MGRLLINKSLLELVGLSQTKKGNWSELRAFVFDKWCFSCLPHGCLGCYFWSGWRWFKELPLLSDSMIIVKMLNVILDGVGLDNATAEKCRNLLRQGNCKINWYKREEVAAADWLSYWVRKLRVWNYWVCNFPDMLVKSSYNILPWGNVRFWAMPSSKIKFSLN